MGIPEFLSKVLETAGRPIDLRDYAESRLQDRGHKRRRQRQLRIGIDITSWVYKAAHGFGDKLCDGRYLTNYGRAALLEEQEQGATKDDEAKVDAYVSACTTFVMTRLETLRDEGNADLLVVLDGDTPPVKVKEVQRRRMVRKEHVRQRDEPLDPNETDVHAANEKRTKANRRAGAGRHFTRIIHELIKCLRRSQIAFLVAPYEADSQLAFLSKKELIDLIITEDSDLVAYGARAVLYRSVAQIGNGKPRGVLLQYETLGSVSGILDFSDFSPVMMAVLFVCLGCDYCEKLKGIGITTAARIVRGAFLKSSSSAMSVIFSQLYKHAYERKLSDEDKCSYEEQFLSALFMYQHSIIYDPVQGKAVMNGGEDLWGESVLMKHKAYAELCEDQERICQIVGIRKDPEAATAAATAAGIGDAPEEEEKDNGDTEEEMDQNDQQFSESHTVLTQEGATFDLQLPEFGAKDVAVNNDGGTHLERREPLPMDQKTTSFPQVEQPGIEIDDPDTENGYDFETQFLSTQQAIPLLECADGEESCAFSPSKSPTLESQILNTQLESAPQQPRAESENTLDRDRIYNQKTNSLNAEHHEPFSEIPLNNDSENCGDSENDETRSPNLLYSSTPEKTVASQGDQTASARSVVESP